MLRKLVSAVVVLSTLLGTATAAAGSCPGHCSTRQFTKPGSYTYRIPTGVTRLHVTVIGAPGGSAGTLDFYRETLIPDQGRSAGGRGATVITDLIPAAGTATLRLTVGRAGVAARNGKDPTYGFDRPLPAQGGGSSVVCSTAVSPCPRGSELAVAGGGGGASWTIELKSPNSSGVDSFGAGGGDAGYSGGNGQDPFGVPDGGGGGRAGTATAAGAGGAGGGYGCVSGKPGSGSAGATSYAGGGDGWFGGGGGASACAQGGGGYATYVSGGGGGGGSSHVDPQVAINSLPVVPSTGPASITITPVASAPVEEAKAEIQRLKPSDRSEELGELDAANGEILNAGDPCASLRALSGRLAGELPASLSPLRIVLHLGRLYACRIARLRQTVSHPQRLMDVVLGEGGGEKLTGQASSDLPVSYWATGSCKIENGVYVVPVAAGTCVVRASVRGDQDFRPARVRYGQFRIAPTPETISLGCPANPGAGQAFNVSGRIVPGGVREVQVTLNGQVTTVPVDPRSGAFAASEPGQPGGTAGTIVVSFAGDSRHAAAAARCSFTTAKAPENLTATCTQDPSTGNLVVSGTLAPNVAGAQITVTAGQSSQTVTVDGSGNYSAASSTQPGTTYDVTASYSGDTAHGPAQATCSLTTAKTAETLTAACSQGSDGLTVSGAISPAIPGAQLGVTYADQQGSTSQSTQASSTGTYRDSDRTYNIDPYTITVTYPGDATHAAASARCTITPS